MKKIIIFLFCIICISVFFNEKESILIPNNSIRFRVIANSDNNDDQKTKLLIKDEVEKELYKVLNNAKNINEARVIINDNIAKIDNIIKKYGIDYDINYGNNYFPTKYYKGFEYKEGNYESLVITLGKGEGHNWWCVLFPPLCLLDEQKDLSNYDYKLYLKELVKNY